MIRYIFRFCKPCLDGWSKDHRKRDVFGRTRFPCPVCSQFNEVTNDRNPLQNLCSLIKTDDYLTSTYSASQKDGKQPGCPQLVHACLVHTDKDCDLFCSDCCQATCHLCAGTLHRKCEQVITVKEVAEDRRAALQIRLKQAKYEKDAALKMKVSLDECWKEYDAKKKTVEEKIKNWGQVTRQSIEEEEKKLLRQLNQAFSHRKNQVHAKINQLLEDAERVSKKLDSELSDMMASSDFYLVFDTSVSNDLTELQEGGKVTMEDCQQAVGVLARSTINVDNYSSISVPKPQITCIDGDQEDVLL